LRSPRARFSNQTTWKAGRNTVFPWERGWMASPATPAPTHRIKDRIEAAVVYDRRLAEAARQAGLRVEAPGLAARRPAGG
jgi:hypothetical protein